MKIDLKKLQRVAIQLASQNLPGGVAIDNSLTQKALEVMVTNVLNFNETSFTLAPNNIRVAINTLVDLKILILDDKDKPPVQQLNS